MKTLLIAIVFGWILSISTFAEPHTLLISDATYYTTNITKFYYPQWGAQKAGWRTNIVIKKYPFVTLICSNLNPSKAYIFYVSANNIDWVRGNSWAAGKPTPWQPPIIGENTNRYTLTLRYPIDSTQRFYKLIATNTVW
jgi:hypothetical protein